MTEAITGKEVCSGCGAGVREGTTFCYACGTKIVHSDTSPAVETLVETAVDEEMLEATVASEPLATTSNSKSEKIASAAAERKKSRLGKRKPKKIVWEEPDIRTNRVFVFFTVVIFAIAIFVVVFTVLIK